MTVHELRAMIDKGKFPPVVYLYGEDDFLIERETRSIKEKALAGGDSVFNSTTFWGAETNAGEIVAAAYAYPFMAERRVVIVRDAGRVLGDARLAAYVENPAPDTVMILTADALPKSGRRKSPVKGKAGAADTIGYLKSQKNASGRDVTVEFKRMKENVLPGWIQEEFAKYGKSITPQACAVFHALKGNDTRDLAAEIEKVHLSQPDSVTVDEDALYELLGASRQYNMYEFSNAVLSRNMPLAIEIALAILPYESPTALVFFLTRQFILLWQIGPKSRPSDEEARKIGLTWGWQYGQMQNFRKNYPDERAYESIFAYLLQADVELKSRSTDPALVLTRLIHQIAGPGKAA